MEMFFRRWLFLVLVISATLLVAACGSSGSGTAAISLPDFVRNAPQSVQASYQFAIEHPELLTHQPCYCGCGVMGHMNNLDCFIGSIEEDGTIIFDRHGAGCGICVDIALDVKRLSELGRSQLEIRRYIDATYSPFGPSTDTPLPDA
jgi:hypothetical protein